MNKVSETYGNLTLQELIDLYNIRKEELDNIRKQINSKGNWREKYKNNDYIGSRKIINKLKQESKSLEPSRRELENELNILAPLIQFKIKMQKVRKNKLNESLKNDLDNKFDDISSNYEFANEQEVGKFGGNKLGTTNFDLNNMEKQIISRDSDWKNETLAGFDELESLAESIVEDFDDENLFEFDEDLDDEDLFESDDFDDDFFELDNLDESTYASKINKYKTKRNNTINKTLQHNRKATQAKSKASNSKGLKKLGNNIKSKYHTVRSNSYRKKIGNLNESLDIQLYNLMEASLRKDNIRKVARENANKDSKRADRAKAEVIECKERIIQIKSRIKTLKEKIKSARKPETYKESLVKAQQRLKKAQENLREAQLKLREANSGKRETIKSKAEKVEAKRNDRNAKSKVSKHKAKVKSKRINSLVKARAAKAAKRASLSA